MIVVSWKVPAGGMIGMGKGMGPELIARGAAPGFLELTYLAWAVTALRELRASRDSVEVDGKVVGTAECNPSGELIVGSYSDAFNGECSDALNSGCRTRIVGAV